jgi:hypothetical protein
MPRGRSADVGMLADCWHAHADVGMAPPFDDNPETQ